MSQIDIRLHGTPEDVARFGEFLQAVTDFMQTGELSPVLIEQRGKLRVLSCSAPYRDRGQSVLVRSYIKAEFE